MSTYCKVDGCERRYSAKGYCQKHYYWAKRNGLLPSRPCSVDGCESPSYRKGMCNKHYLREKRHGDPSVAKRNANGTWTGVQCSVEGCESQVCSDELLCSKHLRRLHRHGSPHVKKKLANGESTPERRKAVARKAMETYMKTPAGIMRRRWNQFKRRAWAGTEKGITKEQFQKVWDQPTCGICGKYFDSDEEKTFDHIVPLAVGGKNELLNLTMAHMKCNQEKGDKVAFPSSDWSALLEPLGASI